MRSKMKSSKMEHAVKKYPALLSALDAVVDDGSLRAQGDVGVRRMLRKHASRNKRLSQKETCFRARKFEKRARLRNETLFTCPVCRDVLHVPITITCGHTYCRDCLGRIEGAQCCECATNVESSKSTNILVQDIVDKWRQTSSKENALTAEFRYCLRSRCGGLHDNIFDGLDLQTSKDQNFCSQSKIHDLANSWLDIDASDLECILCSQCLLSPVTTTCGHTFCRECLARVLDHGLACPLCMAPLKTSEQYRGETQVLNQALQSLAFEEHQERVNMFQQEIYNLENGSDIPIFICTNAFPKVACPLFVYEPRYRLLARRCLQSKRKRFGMAAKTANGDKFALYGTLLEIRDCVNLQDGTSILTTIGLRRFKVLNRGEQDGYDTAMVQFIRDNTVAVEKLPALIALHHTVHNKTVRWLETLKSKLLAEIERCIGCMPEVEENWLTLPDGPAWTWWLVAVLPLSIQLRVGFLASTSLEKRLLAIEKMLDHLKIRMKAVERSALNCSNPEESAESCSYSERSVDIAYQNVG